MDYTLIVVIQLAYIVPSLILYLMQFCFIFLSRDPEFSSAFHYIFLARAPADMMQVIVSLWSFRFPLVGWMSVLDKPYIAKVGFVVSQYTCLLELFAQLTLSVNRFTALYLPVQHNRCWKLTTTIRLFIVCAVISLIPTCVRLPQEAGYVCVDDRIVPRLVHEEDQQMNSYISSSIYIFFGLSCFLLNAMALLKHSQQRNLKLFDTQQALARKIQLNLLVYSSSFTLAILSMTICQGCAIFGIWAVLDPISPRSKCTLALGIFTLGHGRSMVILMLTLSADYFALSNPWLLLALSSSFRSKFLKLGSPKQPTVSIYST